MLDFKKVLLICAHPDDESISCGGTVSKLIASGTEVVLVMITKGSTGIDHTGNYNSESITMIRKKELLSAAKILGIERIRFLDKKCQEVVYNAELMRQIVDIIRSEKPNLVITHTQHEKHNDHKEISKTVVQAAWKAQEAIMPELGESHRVADVWGFECVDILPRTDYVVDISKSMKIKLRALEAYKSQENVIKNIKSLVEGINKIRGYQIGVAHAEAFLSISDLPMEVFK